MGQSYGFLGQHHHAHSALRSVPSLDGERSAQPAQTVLSKPPPIRGYNRHRHLQLSLSLSLLQHHLSAVHHHRPTIHHGNRLVRILTSVRQTVSTCPGRRDRCRQRAYISRRCCHPRSRRVGFSRSSWILRGCLEVAVSYREDRVTRQRSSEHRERECRREGHVGGARPGFMEPPHG